ncbi:hypothetical protein GCM10023115_46920 [Pontixanthobacter gangjinensis]|uniref:DUF4595 domain-containing protein n=1 Tax=Christiangramia aestuarii TaxID=1028746 RepID=A0A7M3SX85_9FLAO|nr:hypothetical protein [Christiangramia aestuarii]MUP41216.1 hypothetical protein [Christiangramia aestuarii]
MKTIIKLSGYLLLTALLIGCSEDDESPLEDGPRFTTVKLFKEVFIDENGGPQEIVIPFGTYAYTDGSFDLQLITEDEVNFETIPEMVNGVIKFEVEKGGSKAILSIIPKDDAITNGFLEYRFRINALSEFFRKMDDRNLYLGVRDDELNGMPKGMKIAYDYGEVIYEYFYNSERKLLKIERQTPSDWGPFKSVSKYSYDQDGKLSTIMTGYDYSDLEPVFDQKTIYNWENDRILSTEFYILTEKQEQTFYTYDEKGNVITKESFSFFGQSEKRIFYRSAFTYNNNNELVKVHNTEYYYPNEWYPDEGETNTFITYDNYLEYSHTFPFNEIIPGVIFPKNLPGTMKSEGDGLQTQIFNYTYEFDSEGKVTQRSTTDEFIVFEYQ